MKIKWILLIAAASNAGLFIYAGADPYQYHESVREHTSNPQAPVRYIQPPQIRRADPRSSLKVQTRQPMIVSRPVMTPRPDMASRLAMGSPPTMASQTIITSRQAMYRHSTPVQTAANFNAFQQLKFQAKPQMRIEPARPFVLQPSGS